MVGISIGWLYSLQRTKASPTKSGVSSLIQNCYWCCNSSFRGLISGVYPFIAITHRSTRMQFSVKLKIPNFGNLTPCRRYSQRILRHGCIMWIELPWPENLANTYAQHTEALNSCFDLIRSHQQCIPWSLPLEIEPATTDCSAESLQLSHQFMVVFLSRFFPLI